MTALVGCGDDSSSSPASKEAPATLKQFFDTKDVACSATDNMCAKIYIEEDLKDTVQCNGTSWEMMLLGKPVTGCEKLKLRLIRPLKLRLIRPLKLRLTRLPKLRLIRPLKLRLTRLPKLRLTRPLKLRLIRLLKLRLTRPPKLRLLVVQPATWLAMFRVWLNAFRLPRNSAQRSRANGLKLAR